MSKDRTAYDLNKTAVAARDLLAALRSDDAELIHDMVEGETSFFEAIDAALIEIDECQFVVDGCHAREAAFAARRQRAEKRQERIRTLIEQSMLMAEIPTVKRATGTLTVKDVSAKPVITDEAMIPPAYWRQPDPVLDKAKINKATKAGEAIPGITMSNGGKSLQIRRA